MSDLFTFSFSTFCCCCCCVRSHQTHSQFLASICTPHCLISYSFFGQQFFHLIAILVCLFVCVVLQYFSCIRALYVFAMIVARASIGILYPLRRRIRFNMSLNVVSFVGSTCVLLHFFFPFSLNFILLCAPIRLSFYPSLDASVSIFRLLRLSTGNISFLWFRFHFELCLVHFRWFIFV